jgi:hypothetical protein
MVTFSRQCVGTFLVHDRAARKPRENVPNRLQAESSMNETRLLYEILPYRMYAVSTLNRALQLRAKWSDAPSMTIYVDGKLEIEGNFDAFANPAIEAGLVHCRALLEFLGLCNRNAALSNIEKRHRGDFGIEHFKNAAGHLKMVDPEAVLKRYGGGQAEAEKALLCVFHVANKGLAHITQDLKDHPEQGALLEIASRGIPSLVVSYLYTPLGIPAPDYKITSRPRDGQA